MVSPYHSVVDLDPNESRLQLEQIFSISRPGRGETDNQKINISGGIAIFRKDAIMRIGGWNEDFWSWGAEDDFQTIKVESFLSWKELNGKCFHLYHERSKPDMNYYQRNLQILQNAKSLTKDQLQKMIINQIPKIGWKNKCDNF